MVTSRTRGQRTHGRTTMMVGPFKGVRTTRDPFDDPPDLLVDLQNAYIPDPAGGSGVYARPGFELLNGGDPIHTSASAFRGQAIYSHPAIDGSTTNWVAMGGRLFRADLATRTFTDVTPIGVTIDSAVTTRVFFCSCVGTLVVTDGVHRPWIATDLASTPITGTYIDYDGAGVEWTAFGKPTLYLGSVFFVLNQVGGVSRRMDLAWSEPGLPAQGYQQAAFDNNWTLETATAGPIYAIRGTNAALYYWRELSIGSASGSTVADLQSSATEDSVSFNVGTQASQTIQEFGTAFFFCDAIGRPWRFQPGQAPEPLWYQMRAVVDDSALGAPTITSIVATSVIEPTLNLWLVGIWSPTPSAQEPVNRLFVFDAHTGIYQGFWTIGPGIGIDCIGSVTDGAGRVILVVLGSALESPATSGYVWSFNSLSSEAQVLTTQAALQLAAQDGDILTTQGLTSVWRDNGSRPPIAVTTGRLGYEADTMWSVDGATIITLTDAAVSVTVLTSAVANTVEGIPEPSLSQDGTCRLVVGCDIVGRGPQITLRPLTADEQWSLQQITVRAMPCRAGWEDA